VIRLLPLQYLSIKEILLREDSRLGSCLTKAAARALIKIGMCVCACVPRNARRSRRATVSGWLTNCATIATAGTRGDGGTRATDVNKTGRIYDFFEVCGWVNVKRATDDGVPTTSSSSSSSSSGAGTSGEGAEATAMAVAT